MNTLFSKVNLIWLNIIGLLIIVALVTHKTDADEIYRYISFASSIASILLAAVAIIYSMIANRGIDQSLSEVRASAFAIAQETSRLNNASQGLSREAEDAIRKLEVLPTQFQSMSGEIGEKIDRVLNASIPERQDGTESVEENQLDPTGMPIPLAVALYAMNLSELTAQSLRPREIFSDDVPREAGFHSYMIGVVEALKLSNNCGIDIEGVFGVYQVKSMGKMNLADLIERVEHPKKRLDYLDYFNKVRVFFDLSEIDAPVDAASEPDELELSFEKKGE